MMIGGPRSARTGHQVRCDLRYSFGLRKQPKVSDGDEVMRIRVAVVILLASAAAAAQVPPQQIFFSRVFPSPKQMGLFIANADGTDEHPLAGTTDVDYDPAWSPDGGWVAFTSERNGSADLYRMRSGWQRPRTAHGQSGLRRSGSVLGDGRQIVFVTTREDGTADLWTLDLQHEVARRRSPRAPAVTSPVVVARWLVDRLLRPIAAPGCRCRMAAGRRCSVADIYLVRPDGTGLSQLTEHAANSAAARSGRPTAAASSPTAWTPKTRSSLRPSGANEGTGSTALVAIDIASGSRSDCGDRPGVKIAPSFVRRRHRVHQEGPAGRDLLTPAARPGRRGACPRRGVVAGRSARGLSTSVLERRLAVPDGLKMWSRLRIRASPRRNPAVVQPDRRQGMRRPTTCRRRGGESR